MPRYVYDHASRQLVEVEGDARPPSRVQIIRDLPAYRSPLGDGWIEGRAARREHMKRTGTREVDPGEWRGGFKNERFARKHGLPLKGD